MSNIKKVDKLIDSVITTKATASLQKELEKSQDVPEIPIEELLSLGDNNPNIKILIGEDASTE